MGLRHDAPAERRDADRHDMVAALRGHACRLPVVQETDELLDARDPPPEFLDVGRLEEHRVAVVVAPVPGRRARDRDLVLEVLVLEFTGDELLEAAEDPRLARISAIEDHRDRRNSGLVHGRPAATRCPALAHERGALEEVEGLLGLREAALAELGQPGRRCGASIPPKDFPDAHRARTANRIGESWLGDIDVGRLTQWTVSCIESDHDGRTLDSALGRDAPLRAR
jgi:hypothetical protein